MKFDYVALSIWFNERNTRERLLVTLLGWALIYAVVKLVLLYPLEGKFEDYQKQIKDYQVQIDNWDLQITALKKITESPDYLLWKEQQTQLKSVQQEYQKLLIHPQANEWQKVVSSISHSQEAITIEQIKNFPETVFQSWKATGIKTNLYQQRFNVIFYSDYVTTINYLERLEKSIPNIHWDKIDYEVVKYPKAKVDLEFSIFYEKSN